MIKIIFPNSEQYTCNYKANLSIKEILNDFYKKRRLLPANYEAYDPLNSSVVDTNQNLKENEKISIYLRQVNPDSFRNSDEKIQKFDSTETIWNFEKFRTFSETVNPTGLKQKASKNSLISKLRQKFSSRKYYVNQSNPKDLDCKLENKLSIRSNFDIYNESLYEEIPLQIDSKIKHIRKKKEKRIVPPQFNKETIDLYFDESGNNKCEIIDLEIPLPPPYSQECLNEIQYYPWQSNVECGFSSYCQEDIYSQDFQVYYSESYHTLQNNDPFDYGRISPDHVYSQIIKARNVFNSDIDIVKGQEVVNAKENISLFNFHPFKDKGSPNTDFSKKTVSYYKDSNVSAKSPPLRKTKHVDVSIISTGSDRSSISSIDSIELFRYFVDYDSFNQSVSETFQDDSDSFSNISSSINKQNLGIRPFIKDSSELMINSNITSHPNLQKPEKRQDISVNVINSSKSIPSKSNVTIEKQGRSLFFSTESVKEASVRK